MKILITGATGFLGSHIISRFFRNSLDLPQETILRILYRHKNPWKENSDVEALEGDILDPQIVERAVNGTDAVLHLAGLVERNPKTASRLFDTHILGTRNVCEAAVKNGKVRVIIASSSGTVAASHRPIIHNENSPYSVEIAGHWPYYLSKIYQEKLALSYYEKQGLPVVVLNPSLLLGPGDQGLSSTNDIRIFLNRQITSIPSGGLSLVDVRDVAECFIGAITRGRPGQKYLIGGHNMTVREFFLLIQSVSGVRAPLFSLPETWGRLGAHVLRQSMQLIGKSFPLDDRTIEMAYRFWYLDNSLARQELGFSPRPAEETIRDTVEFLKKNKHLSSIGS